jgi:hypothetical protein
MESKSKSKSTRGTISILKQITLDPILLKSGKKPQEPTNQPALVNVDLERKRASHIMHYLMERKQEHDYADPFELLKNMTDVINVYEPR